MKVSFKHIGLFAAVALVAVSCTKDENSPGLEYMPDMYRSPSIEAYVDYGEVRNEEHPEWKTQLTAKTPPLGTIPFYSNSEKASANMPLPFKAPFMADKTHGLHGWPMYETAEEFEAAIAPGGVIDSYTNPIPYSDAAAKEGLAVYSRMCAHCHGKEGKGDGPISTNGKLSGIPDLSNPPNSKGSDGIMFYYITYGKGAMGAHGMLLSREERWQVIHQLRKWQDKDYPNVGTEELPVFTDTVAAVDSSIVALPEPPPPPDVHDEDPHGH